MNEHKIPAEQEQLAHGDDMIFNDINTAVEFLRMTIDGSDICVTRADFVDLQASPSVFFDMDSQEGIILREWQQSPCPFRHLPLVWLLPILKELGIQSR